MKVPEQCGIAALKGNQSIGLIRRNIIFNLLDEDYPLICPSQYAAIYSFVQQHVGERNYQSFETAATRFEPGLQRQSPAPTFSSYATEPHPLSPTLKSYATEPHRLSQKL